MNQQLDITGGLHDLAPEHKSMRLFDSAPQIRGQIALDTDPEDDDDHAMPIRALTVKQPWASLIIHGGKDVENRSWRTTHRGPLLIHAAKHDDDDGWERVTEGMTLAVAYRALPRSAIIGVVDVVDCVDDASSRWAIPGAMHWMLARPRAIDPISCRGWQMLWTPDDHLKRRVRRRLASPAASA